MEKIGEEGICFYLQKDLLLEGTQALVLAREAPLHLLQQMLDLEAVAGKANASLKVTLLQVLPHATPVFRNCTIRQLADMVLM